MQGREGKSEKKYDGSIACVVDYPTRGQPYKTVRDIHRYMVEEEIKKKLT